MQRVNKGILATAIVVAAALHLGSPARAARPLVLVLPANVVENFWFSRTTKAAFGLYVPGAGGTISRDGAIASLRRGKVENAVLGGIPSGKVLVDLVSRLPAGFKGRLIVVVALPPPGEHPNTKRYPVAIVGVPRAGILTSESTRIRGLVSITDIAPTAVAFAAGRNGPIRAKPDENALVDLDELDARMTRVHGDRGWTTVVVVFTLLALVLLAPRAAVLGGAAATSASLLLAWAGATRVWVVLPAMVALTAALALAAGARRRLVPLAVAAFFAAFTAVLAVDPELNSLGVLGARPDGGGRFYGIGNQAETLLLPPVLAAVFIGGRRWFIPLAALALVTIGWSKAGADGGGVLVFGAALAVLALSMRGLALTPRRLALAGAAVVVVALVLVGLDAALGGSSHVTNAVGTGPGSLVGDIGHRLHLSWESATDHWYRILIFLACLGALVLMGTMQPRRATVDALLAGLAVSLLVNDTPVDVIGLGALGCLVLVRWESVDSRPMRLRAFTAAAVLAVLALALAGCGDEGTARPVADTVVGTVQAEAPGKAVFLSQACGGCHTFKPAGPDASGQIGPDLDKLPQYAKAANQPLAQFVHESIVDPDRYIEKGYPKGVMPKSYKDLPANDLKALVDFLTKPQG